MNPVAMSTLAAAVGVPLTFLALRHTVKFPPPGPTERSMADLQRDYRPWDLQGALCMLGSAGAAVWPFWGAFRLLGALALPHVPDAVYVLWPGPFVWALPAMYLSQRSGIPIREVPVLSWSEVQ
jgi:hypothetical protein